MVYQQVYPGSPAARQIGQGQVPMKAASTAYPIDSDGDARLEDPGVVKVAVQRAAGLPPFKQEADLLDIWKDGAKLLASYCPQIQETLHLEIKIPELGHEISLPATVRWRQPASGDTWRLGCAFAETLPENVLGQLAVLGYVERRKDPRQKVNIEAHARWELAKEEIPIRIVSISAGGLGITCPQTGKIGERLLVRLGDDQTGPVFVHARAVWQMPVGGDFLIGCALASRADHELLRGSLGLPAAGRLANAWASQWKSVLVLALLVVLSAVLLVPLLLFR
jgi:hypothetical protein